MEGVGGAMAPYQVGGGGEANGSLPRDTRMNFPHFALDWPPGGTPGVGATAAEPSIVRSLVGRVWLALTDLAQDVPKKWTNACQMTRHLNSCCGPNPHTMGHIKVLKQFRDQHVGWTCSLG